MRLAFADGVNRRERFLLRWFRLRKRIFQLMRYRAGTGKDVLLVAGCQRSGTSLIHHVLRLDWDAVTFDEVSPLSAADHVEKLRWSDRRAAVDMICGARAPFVVAKPLVESQNLDSLLSEFPRGRALWMYRDFRAVAKSNLHFFGSENGHRDLAPVIAGDTANWRAENLAPEVIDTVRSLASKGLSDLDAAALFWYCRNSLFFTQGFDGDERVALCRYEDLVADPVTTMRAVYDHVGRSYPGDRITSVVIGSGSAVPGDVVLSPAVDDLCRQMLARLDGSRTP